MKYEIKNNRLYFDGCDTVELAKKYGTPSYIVSKTEIKERFEQLRECFLDKYENTRVAYAAKAFFPIAMAKFVSEEGMCVDVVSGGELYTAIKAGFPAERIEFNGNNKLKNEIESAIDYGVGRIIIDGTNELDMIESYCKEIGKKAKVLYRITPGVKSSSHDYIVTGKKDSKFGIPLDDEIIMPAVKRAMDSDFVELLGFHFHVGSQLFENEPYLKAMDIVLELLDKLNEAYGFVPLELNVGGGFAVTYINEERPPYDFFLDPIMKKIECYFEQKNINRPAVVIEPGRSIVAEAGLTLYTAGSIKTIPGIRKYLAVDGGMTDNIRPALYQAEYRCYVANKAGEKPYDEVTVCGKCCESGDVIIKDAILPKAESGDIIAVLATGAYGYSMASNYNKMPIPPVIFVEKGESKLIVKRQSYDDMLSNDVI